VVTGDDPGTLVVSWVVNPLFVQVDVEYRPIGSSVSRSMRVTTVASVDITGLLNFTRYAISVTPTCQNMMMSQRATAEAVTMSTGSAFLFLPSFHLTQYLFLSFPI
jgi:hypothetical protein